MKRRITPGARRRLYEALLSQLGTVRTLSIRPKGPQIANVVALHGFRAHFETLMPLLTDLSLVGCNIIACDLPNHGGSIAEEDSAGKIHRFKEYIDAAKVLVTVARWSRTREGPIFILGYSLGALITIRLLQTVPYLRKDIAGLVLLSTPLRVDHNVSSWLRKIPFVGSLAKALAKLAPNRPVDTGFFSRDGRRQIDDDSYAQEDDLFYTGPLTAQTAIKIHVNTEKAREGILQLKMPALFVHGREDDISPCEPVEIVCETLRGAGRDVTLKVYSEIGHDIINECPKRLSEDVIPWIQKRVQKSSI